MYWTYSITVGRVLDRFDVQFFAHQRIVVFQPGDLRVVRQNDFDT